jgi:hypothetical protein
MVRAPWAAVTRALRDDLNLVAPFTPEEYQSARILRGRPERLAPPHRNARTVRRNRRCKAAEC